MAAGRDQSRLVLQEGDWVRKERGQLSPKWMVVLDRGQIGSGALGFYPLRSMAFYKPSTGENSCEILTSTKSQSLRPIRKHL